MTKRRQFVRLAVRLCCRVLALPVLGAVWLGGCTPVPVPPTSTGVPSPLVETPLARACASFEDLPLGAVYTVPQRFGATGLAVGVNAFQWDDGQWTADGFAVVGDDGLAGGSGQELAVNNANLDFSFCGSLTELRVLFGEYGGNMNIDINGEFRNFANLDDLDGSMIGDVAVSVVDGFGSDTGGLELSGRLDSFAIGGQELCIDEVCPSECEPAHRSPLCVEFEELPLGTIYSVPQRFTDSGVQLAVRVFHLGGGQWTDGGGAQVRNEGDAGGSGQEMMVGNVNLEFDFGTTVEGLTLLFGEYGGNLNIAVNGEFKDFDDFVDIDDSVIGGAHVSVADGLGNDVGRLELSGPIEAFVLGGQELWIDHVCPGGQGE